MPPAGWDTFLGWTARFVAWEDFALNGRDEVVEQRETMQLLQAFVERGDPRLALGLQEAFNVQTSVGWRAYLPLVKAAEEDPATVRRFLDALWSASPRRERVAQALERLPDDLVSGPGTRLGVVSALLPDGDCPPYQARLAEWGARLCGMPAPAKDATPAERYEAYLAFLDTLCARAQARRIDLADRLDAYAALVWVAKCDTWFDKGYGPAWPQADRDALVAWAKARRTASGHR